MARLKITIEGEMSPEEMHRYITATWGDFRNLPRESATYVTEVEPPTPQTATPAPAFSEPVSTAPAPESAAPEAPPAPAGAKQLSEAQIMELASGGKLSAIVQAVQALGVTDTQAIIAEVLRIKGAVPGLARLSEDALADRITRVLELMK